ncbi:Uncharacterized protein FWK35_00024519 [Aphis craccivora]|uniref:Uncharacterized protein n=1 Tax=Aphis craccivora TaxID=307492 RepID=A0A6G0ZD78_APHCR|nr:Uncharacterized protein FWK35_00024519 [Aphis craccivora]
MSLSMDIKKQVNKCFFLILSGAMNVLILQCCMFFFFLYLCTQGRVEIMLQFQTMGVVSDGKMNLVGALGRSFFEIPNSFQKHREKQKKKIKEKKNENLYAKPVFDQIDIFYMVFLINKNKLNVEKEALFMNPIIVLVSYECLRLDLLFPRLRDLFPRKIIFHPYYYFQKGGPAKITKR